MDKKLKISCAS